MGRLFTTVVIILFAFNCFGQYSDTTYEARWLDIDTTFTQKSLNRTALNKVNDIYKLAKRNGQQAQVVKALLYRMFLEQSVLENNISRDLDLLKKEISGTRDLSTKHILESILAEKYQRYYEQVRYRIYRRTTTVDYKQDDVTTWTIDDLHREITYWYQQSLSGKEVLQQQRLQQYDAILNVYSKNFYRPTLYDLLVHRALRYFKDGNAYLAKPLYAFVINDPAALGSMQAFIQTTFKTNDSASNKLKALLLYQDLLRFHTSRKDTAALIDANLERIQYVSTHSDFSNKDSLYYAAVKETAEAYKNNRHSAEAYYLLAQYHAEKASQFAGYQKDTTARYEYIKALDIIRPFLPLTDSTIGHHHLYNLYANITARSLSLQTEEVTIPNLPFKMLVSYKNVDTLYYRIIRANKAVADTLKKYSTYNQRNKKSFFQVLKDLPFSSQTRVAMPLVRDYQPHTVEVKIEPLAVGEYYIFASVSPTFDDTTNLAWQEVYVSNISFINSGTNYFVLDRTTGQPLQNAHVQVWEYGYKRGYEKKEKYTTSANGHLRVKPIKDKDRSIQLEISYKDDRRFIQNDQYLRRLVYNNNDDDDDYDDDAEYEEDHAHVFYFTDRSIYRPGQKVYFKMIMLTKDRTTGTTKVFKPAVSDSLYVFLNDANNKEIDSLLVQVNEYGSFAGSFVLPANTLTGEFSLQLDDDFDGETGGSFSVEEYKRPTFEVALQKPKGEYKLGDSLTVQGTATAYAGNANDGATVKYSVTRKGRFLYPWLWSRGIRPVASETTIAFGETKTDANGKFNIGFNAKADETIDRKNLPIFDYVIEADVTDNAGETRSSTLTVSAGYHSLNLQLNVKSTEDADSLKNIFITTTNIAGDKQPAVVKVNVIPLQSPSTLLRKRYWPQPDTYIYSKEAFGQWFPNDEYSNETDKTSWPRLSPVFSTSINTKDTTKAVVPKGILHAGWYVIEASTIDKQGNTIKDEKYVQLYSTKEGQFQGSNYWFTNVISNYVEQGESASFLLGTNAPNAFIIEEIQRKPAKRNGEVKSQFLFHALNKNAKTITVETGQDDMSGMGVNFAMVKDNRVFTWNQRIEVKRKETNVDVQVLTYRDKLEPGSNEKWTVKITGANKDAQAAEVLTSMYDASLDQFKNHSWSTPQLTEERFYAQGWNSMHGFSFKTSQSNYISPSLKPAWVVYPEIITNIYDNLQKHPALKARISRELAQAMPQMQSGGRLPGIDANQRLDEVVVTGYGRKQSLSASVTIRGAASVNGTNSPLIIVDGKVVNSMDDVNPDDIGEMQVLKNAEATSLYGARGANGVILISRKGAASINAEQQDVPVKVRTNFNETAFFFPQLHTDAEGNLSFTFTLPEALTQWKWQVLAHNKTAGLGLLQRTIVSQKALMVQMNAPRFLRQGDSVELSAKVSNLNETTLNGTATLELINAINGNKIDHVFMNTNASQSFSVDAKQSSSVRFAIVVPADFSDPITWRIVAKAGSVSDGEENSLPVLSKRLMVTETLPMFVRGDGQKTFQFSKLLNNQSSTLQHQSLTIEYTPEPAWYAIQSLPYLVQYPYECAEQTFNKFFANALAATIVNSHPRIKQVMDEWMKKDPVNGQAELLSNLSKNKDLKNVLLQETPWVLQAASEAQQQKNIAVLFDVVRMSKEFKTYVEKLKQLQMQSGGFAWFKGGHEDRYITQYIVTGIGRLRKMNAMPEATASDMESIARKALSYLDAANVKDYETLVADKVDLKKLQLASTNILYLYMRSLFSGKDYALRQNKAVEFYTSKSKQQWNDQSTYFKAMIGAALLNNGDKDFVHQNILPALLENAVYDSDSAMYWKDMQRGYYWYQAPVEQQVMIMELINDIAKQNKSLALESAVDDMKTWLLKQKQTNHWVNTKATADACFALVLTGSNLLNTNRKVTIQAGGQQVSENTAGVAGTGYIKKKIEGSRVTSSMGNIIVTTQSAQPNNTTPSWGAAYWQYFEDMDKITTASTPLSVQKNLFTEVNTATGKALQLLKDGDTLKVGDKLKVRIILRSDRDMEYIHLKDMRAAGSEPVNVLSGYKWQDGLGYYESTRDAATSFFISNLPKGTYVFEYPLFITHSGNFSVGIATAQGMYAPEFSSHSQGIRIVCKQ